MFNPALLIMWDRILSLLWERCKAISPGDPERGELERSMVDVMNWTLPAGWEVPYSEVSFGVPCSL